MFRRPLVFRCLFSLILFPARDNGNDNYRRQRTNNDLKKFIHNTFFRQPNYTNLCAISHAPRLSITPLQITQPIRDSRQPPLAIENLQTILQLHMHRRRHRLPPLEGESDGEVMRTGKGGKWKVDANTSTIPKRSLQLRIFTKGF